MLEWWKRIIDKHTGLINASWAGLMQLPAPNYTCQMLSGQNALLQSFVNVPLPPISISQLFTDTHASRSLQDVLYPYIVTMWLFSVFWDWNINYPDPKNDHVTLDHPPCEWNHNEGSSWQLLVFDPEQVCLTCTNGSGLKQVGCNFDEGKNTNRKGTLSLKSLPFFGSIPRSVLN